MSKTYNGRTVGPLLSPQWNALHRINWFDKRQPESETAEEMTVPDMMSIAAVLTQPVEVVEEQIASGTFAAETEKFFAKITVSEFLDLFFEINRATEDFLGHVKLAETAGPQQ